MILTGGPFWFLMGVVFVLVAAAFLTFAQDRGWVITWWKGLLAVVWYAALSLSFYAWGTLIGEGEAGAGFKLFLIGLFVTIVLGVALLRLFAHRPRSSQ
jgi:hypothetical protein